MARRIRARRAAAKCADRDSDCRLTALALQRLPAGCGTVLEIGCGTGRQTLDLAMHWPQTRFCGVDISSGNIAAAREAIAQAQLTDRVAAIQADYMAFEGGPFDCILADSALHFFDAPPETIFARIAAQLRPGGTLLINATYRCPSNILVRAVRTAYRLLPSVPWTGWRFGRPSACSGDTSPTRPCKAGSPTCASCPRSPCTRGCCGGWKRAMAWPASTRKSSRSSSAKAGTRDSCSPKGRPSVAFHK